MHVALTWGRQTRIFSHIPTPSRPILAHIPTPLPADPRSHPHPLPADLLSHPHASRPIPAHIPTPPGRSSLTSPRLPADLLSHPHPSRPIFSHIPTGHEECRRCPVMIPGWTFCRSHVQSDRSNSNSGGKPRLAPRSSGKLPLMQSISRAWTTSHGASMPVDFGFLRHDRRSFG